MNTQIKTLIFLFCCCIIDGLEAVKQSHYIHWNTTNPIFRIDNTDHIIDVNQGNKPWEYDQVNIICPVYRQGHLASEDKETSVIYSVSKDEYETCRITQPHPRVIAVCNQPHELMYFTITFRSFTPTPGGMEFTPGKDYYFITTSTSDDLYRRVGGRCQSNHMKVAFKVADNVQHHTTTTHKPAVNMKRPRPPFYPPGAASSSASAASSDNVMDHKGYGAGFMLRHPSNSGSGAKKYDRSHDYTDSHPNDVIKHEASRLAVASTASAASPVSVTDVVAIASAVSWSLLWAVFMVMV